MSNVNDLEEPTNEMAGRKKEVEFGDGSGVKLVMPAVYHLSSSDSPGNVLIACRLNGENYLTWSRAMRTALKAKNKLPFIDGSLRKPGEDDPSRERWEMCNSMLIAWIFNTMEEELQAGVACATDARSLWDDLKERYSQGNQTRIYQLKSEICLLKQEGQAVQKYYSKMKTLWDELENYLETPNCNCGAIGGFVEQKEKEKGYQFLMGLDPEFATVRSNILSVEPMPSLNKIYSMVIHEERQKAVARSLETKPEAAVFLAKGNSSDTGKKFQPNAYSRLSCVFCGKSGTQGTIVGCYTVSQLDGKRRKERNRLGEELDFMAAVKELNWASGSRMGRPTQDCSRSPGHSRSTVQFVQMQHRPPRAQLQSRG